MAGAMLLLAITPGPGVFATVSRALASGFKQSTFVALGIVTGDLIFLLFAIFGLSALASLMGTFFIVVKYIGGLYLLYLGFKIWTSSPTDIKITTTSQNTSLSNFFSGLTITLGNPKVILFYLGFLPTFIDLERLGMGDVVTIAVIVSTVLGLTMLGYGYMASRAKQMVKSKRTGHLMNYIAGGVMMSTGAILIAKS
jgi:threonine/homoserine/homoserine lactone efflux protein